MHLKAAPLLVICITMSQHLFSQADSSKSITNRKDSVTIPDKDLKDVFSRKRASKKTDSLAGKQKVKKYFLTVLPGAGYTLQTGFAGLISANIGYYNDKGEDAKISSITTSLTYSEYNQIIFPLYADIWSKGGKYNFISDNRYISYPSDIFGLGGATDPNQDHTIDFNLIKLHQTVLRRVYKDLYAGIGVYYDYFWKIKVIDPQTRLINVFIQKEIGNSATAIGPAFKLLYDSRANQINPQKGNFLNVVLRQNLQELGSDDEWASLLIDARKYINFPRGSKNTLAFWSYNWLTLAGDLNYLLLPSTAWDDQYNTGRGYVQSRFRGRQMTYFETEYRYGISRNGLLGGVVFFNVEHFSGNLRPYNTLLPGYGAGIRVKLNKKSGANLCLDYGFGNGSSGFYVNLGEVF
ncbi:BamA/TamA family outer membrane protein [Asinibacterium sp. OR53]|uniref:BamA/TamA family outer membrane protein n=1 Tax=Asinibacterium sp. OR53 TaxID=925409 RepID=UPI000410E125|nr:BamA/TamA family outer membrane protein [Asinibacterium sp. OR53]